MKRILFMAGGTGGHIHPALTVAKALEKQGHKIYWLGGAQGLEHKIITDYPLYSLAITGLRGKTAWQSAFAPARLMLALFQALRIVRHVKPDLVMGFGGYASGPGGLAAWMLRKPLLIHEQNAIAGYTNRLLSKLAKKILRAFPCAFNENIKAITVGNPVRDEIINIEQPKKRLENIENRQLRLLILGGSQGARFLNEKMADFVGALESSERPEIWHQTGQSEFDRTKTHYQKKSINAKCSAFIDNMADAYQWADLVVCRAGALTVSELAAAGVGCVFIPFPFAVDNHQFYNAQYLVEANAAHVIVQSAYQTDTLVSLWRNFLNNRQQLVNLACAARTQSRPDSCEEILQICQPWLTDKNDEK